MLTAFQKLLVKARRKNPIPHPAAKPVSFSQEIGTSMSSSPLIDNRELMSFQREYAHAQDYAAKYRVLRIHWEKVSKTNFVPSEWHHEVLSALIGYKYIAQAYTKAGFSMPKPVAQNLAALEKNDLKSLTPNMARMMNILTQMNTKQGEAEMVKKANNKAAPGVVQFYLEIFEAQAKARLTDEQIAETIENKSGKRPTPKNIASYRCMYNAGNLSGQSKVPTDKVKAVRPPSVAKPKKPMSEETKAKLKAYTAAKKAKAKKTTKKK